MKIKWMKRKAIFDLSKKGWNNVSIASALDVKASTVKYVKKYTYRWKK